MGLTNLSPPRRAGLHLVATPGAWIAAIIVFVAAGCDTDADPTDPVGAAAVELTLAPPAIAIDQGSSVEIQGSISRTDYTGPLGIWVDGESEGFTASVGTPVDEGSTTSVPIRIDVEAEVLPQEHELTVGVFGEDGISDTAVLELVVFEPDPGPFRLTLEPEPEWVAIAPGDAGQVEVTIERENHDGAVTLSLAGLPDGVTAAFDPNPGIEDRATLTLEVDASADPGIYELTIEGEAEISVDGLLMDEVLAAQAPLTLIVAAAP